MFVHLAVFTPHLTQLSLTGCVSGKKPLRVDVGDESMVTAFQAAGPNTEMPRSTSFVTAIYSWWDIGKDTGVGARLDEAGLNAGPAASDVRERLAKG